MNELYTAAQLVLLPFVVLTSIIGAASVVHMAVGLITGNARKAAWHLIQVALCIAAIWSYLLLPGGLG